MSGVAPKAIGWTESGPAPDTVTRGGMMRQSPVALVPENDGNEWFVAHCSFKKGGD